jgi:hypothetical protein
MLIILLPSGNRVSITNGTVYVNPTGADTTVVFSFAAGSGVSPVTETFLTAETAAYFVTQLDALISSGKQGVFSLWGSPATLDAVAPNPFAMHTDTINVNGAGFDPATLGTLYLNDVGTAPDFNGYEMTVTYVSPNQLTAVWSTDGADVPVLNELITYYKDSAGRVSNVLTGVYISDLIALTWTSVTPNTVTTAELHFTPAIVGTGFLGSGIQYLKLHDGLGNENISTPVNIADDANMSADFGHFIVTGVFTLYYSTDFGSSWTTTGLTVTVS